MPWDDTCSPLFWEQWRNRRRTRTCRGLEEIDDLTVKDGVLKECAKELDSPVEQCIFKENKEKCEICESRSNINF